MREATNYKVISGLEMNINILRSLHIFEFESNLYTHNKFISSKQVDNYVTQTLTIEL